MVTKTVVFSPFSRLEGDLEVRVDIEDGRIARALAAGTLYRGFEVMLRGRDILDAIVFVCRVCGQCGAAHSSAAVAAIRALTGTEPPPNAVIVGNVIQAIECVLSHIAHFFLSFAPDLAEPPYEDGELTRRFVAPGGQSFSRALRAREEMLGVMGLLAGKWPNTLAIQPGGVTKPLSASEIRRARGLIAEFADLIKQQVIGCDPDEWLALRSAAEMDRWLGTGAHAGSDVGIFVAFSLKHGLDKVGAWPARFLSSGGWAGPTGETLMRPGFHNGDAAAFSAAGIAEHVKHSWYEPREGGVPPFDGDSRPALECSDAYSWVKAPRYAGEPAEVGPLARMVNNGDPLVTDLLGRYGPSVFVREMARLHETIHLLRQIDIWLTEVNPQDPFYRDTPRAVTGSAFGMVEAPRGTLGHWLRAEGGRICNYQIITPTGWNLSPRDSDGRPGPLETALVGTPVPDPDRPVVMSHVVKSFDPCLFCTVH